MPGYRQNQIKSNQKFRIAATPYMHHPHFHRSTERTAYLIRIDSTATHWLQVILPDQQLPSAGKQSISSQSESEMDECSI